MEINDSVGFLLSAGSRLMRREFSTYLQKYDITPPHWAVLKLLSQENNLTQAGIASKLHYDKTTIGNIIENLLKKKMLLRELSTSDKRSYCISITPESLRMIEDLSPKSVHCTKKALTGLGENEQKLFMETLNKIIKNLE